MMDSMIIKALGDPIFERFDKLWGLFFIALF